MMLPQAVSMVIHVMLAGVKSKSLRYLPAKYLIVTSRYMYNIANIVYGVCMHVLVYG